MNKLIKEVKNESNYLIKLKCEIKKISYTSDTYCENPYLGMLNSDYNTYTKIIIKKLKYFKTFNFTPATLNKIGIKQCFNNLAIDHLTLDYYFYYFDKYYSITPIMQLTTLTYLLKYMNIKKITLKMPIAIFRHIIYFVTILKIF